ncbi:MAG: acetyl-CoA carboxylase biotin carboxyl carrier protein [Planctomycetes bacterium]|nr:acetyl-CoA carboxylase biotin carboxyl carrier protein [Planctomycetota bacterium]
MDIRKLKELVKLMVNNDLAEIDLRDPDEQVTLRRHGENVVVPQMSAPLVAPVQGAQAAPVAVAEPPATTVTSGEEIASPMVGTFYVATDPDSPAFVKVGDTVSKDTTVCIIEAMKIFNEIKAQCAGTVTQVLVENGEAVEFGQPLFIVTP